MELSPTLPHDDIARTDILTAIALHAKSTTNGIATVARTATCFLRCHNLNLSTSTDTGDLDFGELLAMTELAPIILAAAELHGSHFLRLAMTHNLCRHIA